MAKARRSQKKKSTRKKAANAALALFRAPADIACDACGQPRSHHVPLCAEADPRLVTFWASLCDKCLDDQTGGRTAYKNIRSRGWAHAGTVFHTES